MVGFLLSLDWSVLVIMWLFTWSVAATLPDAAPGHSSISYWLAGAKGRRSMASDERAARVLELVRGLTTEVHPCASRGNRTSNDVTVHGCRELFE